MENYKIMENGKLKMDSENNSQLSTINSQLNVPQLRFPEFDGEWEKKILGNIGEIVNGLTYSPDDIDQNGVLVLRSSNVQERNLTFNDNVFVLTNSFNSVKENDILICVRNGSKRLIGKNAIIKKEHVGFAFGAFMTVYRSPQNTFLFQWFDSEEYKKEVHKNLGATINSINSSDLKKFKVPFPTLAEQKKIADFLTAVDSKLQGLKKKKELLEKYKKGVMQKIFSQEIRFKQDNGQDFPDWEVKKLGELTYKVGEKNKKNIKYPIYSINNQEGFRPQSEQFEGLDSNDRGYDISLYKIIYEKTFAYNPARINVGSIGYSFDLNEVIISSLYVCFKTNEELEDLYLLVYIDTNKFNKDILKYEEGGVRQYLFYENFSHIKIPLPNNDEQIKIANFLTAIDERIENLQLQIDNTELFKKGLLQKMFV